MTGLRFLKAGGNQKIIWIVALGLAGGIPALGQNETPGIGKKNHTAYLFSPYRWTQGRLFDAGQWVKKYVNGNADAGQQYDYVEMLEPTKPTAQAPATTCTVKKFRDLIKENKDDMAVLVIITHGGNDDIAIEPFGDDNGAEQRSKVALENYIKNDGFAKEELEHFKTPEHGWAVGVTNKFVEKYRQMSQAVVVIAACNGESMTDDFTDARGQGDDRRARVAIGPSGCRTFAAFNEYFLRFFGDLDGQPSKVDKQKRTDAQRLQLRAVGPAMDAENAVQKLAKGQGAENLRVEFRLRGARETVLAPAVQDAALVAPCPIKAGDVIRITFDTNCDPNVKPAVGDITVAGITVGAPVWKDGTKNVLEIPVTAPADPINTYKIIVPGAKIKSQKSDATLDGNTDPDKENAKGPANSAATPDNYHVEFNNGMRVH